MPEPTDVLAHRVLAENLKVRKGESVLIESWTHTLPTAEAFVREARRLGARPTLLYEDEASWWAQVDRGDFSPFARLSSAERAALAAADVYVYFWGPEDRPRMQALPEKVQEKLTAYNEEWYRVAHRAGLRGYRMWLGQASDAAARKFDVDGATWRRRLVRAGTVDAQRLLAKGRRLARTLESGKKLRIHHPNGTDVALRLGEVHTRVNAGILDASALARRYGMLADNPTGQVLAAIDGARAEGTVVANRPVYLGYNRFEDVRWTFADGRLTSHAVGTGGKMFERQFRGAPKGRDVLGLVSIGLNPESKELFPLEDTEEGAALIGIGNNGFVGGKIRIPFQGYALVGGATIEVDGAPIARDGRVL